MPGLENTTRREEQRANDTNLASANFAARAETAPAALADGGNESKKNATDTQAAAGEAAGDRNAAATARKRETVEALAAGSDRGSESTAAAATRNEADAREARRLATIDAIANGGERPAEDRASISHRDEGSAEAARRSTVDALAHEPEGSAGQDAGRANVTEVRQDGLEDAMHRAGEADAKVAELHDHMQHGGDAAAAELHHDATVAAIAARAEVKAIEMADAKSRLEGADTIPSSATEAPESGETPEGSDAHAADSPEATSAAGARLQSESADASIETTVETPPDEASIADAVEPGNAATVDETESSSDRQRLETVHEDGSVRDAADEASLGQPANEAIDEAAAGDARPDSASTEGEAPPESGEKPVGSDDEAAASMDAHSRGTDRSPTSPVESAPPQSDDRLSQPAEGSSEDHERAEATPLAVGDDGGSEDAGAANPWEEEAVEKGPEDQQETKEEDAKREHDEAERAASDAARQEAAATDAAAQSKENTAEEENRRALETQAQNDREAAARQQEALERAEASAREHAAQGAQQREREAALNEAAKNRPQDRQGQPATNLELRIGDTRRSDHEFYLRSKEQERLTPPRGGADEGLVPGQDATTGGVLDSVKAASDLRERYAEAETKRYDEVAADFVSDHLPVADSTTLYDRIPLPAPERVVIEHDGVRYVATDAAALGRAIEAGSAESDRARIDPVERRDGQTERLFVNERGDVILERTTVRTFTGQTAGLRTSPEAAAIDAATRARFRRDSAGAPIASGRIVSITDEHGRTPSELARFTTAGNLAGYLNPRSGTYDAGHLTAASFGAPEGMTPETAAGNAENLSWQSSSMNRGSLWREMEAAVVDYLKSRPGSTLRVAVRERFRQDT